MEVVALKKEMLALKINKLEKGKDSLVVSFLKTTPVDPARLLEYVQTKAAAQLSNQRRKTPGKKFSAPARPVLESAVTRLTPDGRLLIPVQAASANDLFATIHHILSDLSDLSQPIPTPVEPSR